MSRDGEAKRQRDSREEKIRERERWSAREEDQIRRRKTIQRERKEGRKEEKLTEADKQPTLMWGGWR